MLAEWVVVYESIAAPFTLPKKCLEICRASCTDNSFKFTKVLGCEHALQRDELDAIVRSEGVQTAFQKIVRQVVPENDRIIEPANKGLVIGELRILPHETLSRASKRHSSDSINYGGRRFWRSLSLFCCCVDKRYAHCEF